MKAKLLRLLFFSVSLAGLFVLFGLSAYTAFSLFVRSGVTRVPDVLGMGPDEATSVLSDRGLGVASSPDGRHSETVPAGLVARQSPDPGNLLKRGATVTLFVSLGPQRIQTPNLAGQALPSAQVALAAAGLALGETIQVFSEDTPPGTILFQSPEPAAAVAQSQPVDVLLSQGGRGEMYLMPDLVYRDYEVVRQFFQRRGFRLGSVRPEPYEGIAEGVILRQYPPAGHPVSKRDAISLVVAAGER